MTTSIRASVALHSKDQTAGFTLVELAVVIVLISILATMGLGVLSAQLSSIAYTDTKKRQETVKDALLSYISTKTELPCPDDPASGGVTGSEDRSDDKCKADFGVLPYETLGIGRELAQDGWGNYMSYAVTRTDKVCPKTDDWTRKTCVKIRATELLGSFTVQDGTEIEIKEAVAVILSHGSNGLGAYTRQGSRNVTPPEASCDEYLNSTRKLGAGCPSVTNPTTTFSRGERPDNDDVVAYLLRPQLIQQLTRQGNTVSPDLQVQEELSAIRDAATGRVLQLGCNYEPTTIANILPDLNLDPWGQPYEQFDNIKDIKESSNSKQIELKNPSPYAICLYSRGPDNDPLTSPASSCSATGKAIAKGIPVTSLYTDLNRVGWPNC